MNSKNPLSSPAPAPFRLFSGDRLAIPVILAALAFAAYGSAMRGYLLFSDDYILRDSLTDPRNAFHFLRQGAWRILGISVMSAGLNMPHAVYLGLVISLHALNSFLCYQILRKLRVQPLLAMSTAALFAVSPGFHEAIVWVAGSAVVWSCTCFLFTLLLILDNPLAEQRPWLAGSIGVLLALAGNFFNEQLLFAYFALFPAVVWWRGQGWWPRLSLSRLWRFCAPSVGSLLFVLVYLATLGPDTTKQPILRLRAALSPWYYQYSNLMVFDVWRHPLWVRLFGDEILGGPGLIISGTLALGVLGLARLHFRPEGEAMSGPPPGSILQRLAGWSLVCLSASAIYALADGYSLDSRKRYVFVLLMLLAVPHLLSPLKPGRWFRPVLCLLCIFCAATTIALTRARWEMLGIKNEFRIAVDQGTFPAPVWIERWDTSPTSLYRYLWTDMREEMNFHRWPGSSTGRLASSPQGAACSVYYDWTQRAWRATDSK